MPLAVTFDEALAAEGDEQLDGQLVGLGFQHVIFTWCYTIVWFLVQDGMKVLCYKVLYYFDVCGIRSEAEANAERVAKNKAIQAALGEAANPNGVPNGNVA